MKLAVGGDHAGVRLKTLLVDTLRADGHDILDLGTSDETPVDFPAIAQRTCAAILGGSTERGVLVCGTGVGPAIAANKVPGIRAAVGHDVYSAHQGVEHDDVNVLCLGADIVGPALASELLRAFLAARFNPAPEFVRRVAMLAAMDDARPSASTQPPSLRNRRGSSRRSAVERLG